MSADLTTISEGETMPLAADLLDAIAQPCCLLDDTFVIRYVNNPFCAAIGKSRSKIEGTPLLTLLSGREAERLLAMVAGHTQEFIVTIAGLDTCTLKPCTMGWMLSCTGAAVKNTPPQAEAALSNPKLLQAIFDTSLVQISMLKCRRTAEGKVEDFEIIFTNKELERETGRKDLIGKLYAQEYPGIKAAGIFDTMVRVLETGKSEKLEYYYPYEQFNKWFSCSFVKLGDGLVATNIDVTQHKLAEEERIKNYALLSHSERVADFGSWEYDLISGSLSWSEGMYRIFKAARSERIDPGIYIRFSSTTGNETASRIAAAIVAGQRDFTETLEIRAGNRKKTILVKAKLMRSKKGWPVKILGVDMDITRSKKIQEKMQALEKQQQRQIFQMTVKNQEDERRRLSENLHNGLGQLLYGIKIGIARINAKKAARDPERFGEEKQQLEEIVTSAINETRRIAHELVPAALEAHGLFFAAEKMCEQLSGTTRFECSFFGQEEHADKFLLVAVYRMLQELVTNVIKHAQASHAQVSIEIDEESMQLRVTDNGKGMGTTPGNGGIGLKSIAGKVRLLSGTFKIANPERTGTRVFIRLPLSKSTP
ncbi:ATP-binding protein [Pedobacter sp. SYP-B3415]|uniref:sensor histidine kinase n=1 Tax=Pedobacter sp. SYP-B3415 TaxID=2496641 RepID=UPI00101D3806|nr:ATP-binding protein [Pedobacter sp. SYP-B3415]